MITRALSKNVSRTHLQVLKTRKLGIGQGVRVILEITRSYISMTSHSPSRRTFVHHVSRARRVRARASAVNAGSQIVHSWRVGLARLGVDLRPGQARAGAAPGCPPNRRCSSRRSVLFRHRLRPVWRIVLGCAPSPKVSKNQYASVLDLGGMRA